MMNCLEFRRRKLADPRRLDPEAQIHPSGCAACAAFAREVDEHERALDQALMVPVPDGLADRLIFESRRPRARWRAWAIAAGALIALSVGFAYWGGVQQGADDYARDAIEHVVLEPESLAAVRNADAEAFRAVVRELGGSVKDLPGKIRYFKLCPFEGALGWHVVFETPEGLATLFLVPGKKPATAQAAAVKGWSAAVQPFERGYYAVVTQSSNATARFLEVLRDCIAWNA